jgi:hypothetical protein
MRVLYGFFLAVFFCSLIHASDIPVAPVVPVLDPISLRFVNENTDEWPTVEKMSFENLKILAASLKIPGADSMNKDELLEKIKGTGKYNVELIVEKTRFPYFAEVLAELSSQDAIPVSYPGVTSAAVIFLDELDREIMPRTELKTFTESCEKGTYFTPKSSKRFFEQQHRTVTRLHGAITAAHFLLRTDLTDLLLCQYAE